MHIRKAHVLCRDIKPWDFEQGVKYDGSPVDTSTDFSLGFLDPTKRGHVHIEHNIRSVGMLMKHAKKYLPDLVKLPLSQNEKYQLNRFSTIDDECQLYNSYVEYSIKGSDGYDGSSKDWRRVRSPVVISMCGQNMVILFEISLKIANGLYNMEDVGQNGTFNTVQELEIWNQELQKFSEEHLNFWVFAARQTGNLLTSMDSKYSRNEIAEVRKEREKIFKSLLVKRERSRHGKQEISVEDLADALFALYNDLQIVKGLLLKYTS